MRYLHAKGIMALLLIVTMISCKKDKGNTETEPQRMQRPHGAAIGTPISKTIGSEGGVIQTADAGIVVTIPAGAVSAATEFKIQKIESTLPGSQGASFRLLPEGVTFSKPVTIRFSYGAMNMEGTPVELLYLTYQDSEGYFHLMKNTERNTTAKTLTVQSTHFSDWYIFAFVNVTPKSVRIKKGQSVQFKLEKDPIITGNPESGELEVGELELYEPAAKVEWSKSGGGIGGLLVSGGAEADYTAPNTTGVQYIVCTVKDVETPEGKKTEVSWLIEVIVEDNSPAKSYIALKVGNSFNDTLKHNVAGSFYKNTYMSATYTSNGYDPKLISILINDSVIVNKVYRYNNLTVPEGAQIDLGSGFVNNTGLQTQYTNCNGTRVFSPGSIIITKAEPVGGFVEGTFTATVYNTPSCPNGTFIQQPIEGSFKIYRAF